MKNKLSFLLQDPVLTIAVVLAFASMLFQKPDQLYIKYIDFHTLILLFSLMLVSAGLKEIGFFQSLGEYFTKRIHSLTGLLILLVCLCFFSSMLITNDVALIIFVPLGILILEMADAQDQICFAVIFMTLSANLGSMLTPIGNPQNLYLFHLSHLSIPQFLLLMLPYSGLSLLLLIACILIWGKKKTLTPLSIQMPSESQPVKSLILYGMNFVLCILTVAGILSPWLLLVLVLVFFFRFSPSLLRKIDYHLLATFFFLFIFIGNIGRSPVFCAFIKSILIGNEFVASILVSQVISNVPTAILLSNFSTDYTSLIVGTNIGGLGTIIASMASLISYKQLALHQPEKKRTYILKFTFWNLVFLVIFLLPLIASIYNLQVFIF